MWCSSWVIIPCLLIVLVAHSLEALLLDLLRSRSAESLQNGTKPSFTRFGHPRRQGQIGSITGLDGQTRRTPLPAPRQRPGQEPKASPVARSRPALPGKPWLATKPSLAPRLGNSARALENGAGSSDPVPVPRGGNATSHGRLALPAVSSASLPLPAENGTRRVVRTTSRLLTDPDVNSVTSALGSLFSSMGPNLLNTDSPALAFPRLVQNGETVFGEATVKGTEATHIRFRSVTINRGDLRFGRSFSYLESEEPELVKQLRLSNDTRLSEYSNILQASGSLESSAPNHFELRIRRAHQERPPLEQETTFLGADNGAYATAWLFIFDPVEGDLSVVEPVSGTRYSIFNAVAVANKMVKHSKPYVSLDDVPLKVASRSCSNIASEAYAVQIGLLRNVLAIKHGKPVDKGLGRCVSQATEQLMKVAANYIAKNVVEFDEPCTNSLDIQFSTNVIMMKCFGSRAQNVYWSYAARHKDMKPVPPLLLNAGLFEFIGTYDIGLTNFSVSLSRPRSMFERSPKLTGTVRFNFDALNKRASICEDKLDQR